MNRKNPILDLFPKKRKALPDEYQSVYKTHYKKTGMEKQRQLPCHQKWENGYINKLPRM